MDRGYYFVSYEAAPIISIARMDHLCAECRAQQCRGMALSNSDNGILIHLQFTRNHPEIL